MGPSEITSDLLRGNTDTMILRLLMTRSVGGGAGFGTGVGFMATGLGAAILSGAAGPAAGRGADFKA